MELKKVNCYQTSDKQLHSDKIQALSHEFRIELRGIVQNALKTNGREGANLSTTDVAGIVAANSDSFIKTIRTYKEKIRRATPEIKI